MNTPKPIETMNFEDALGELEVIVRGLESGETSLENSIAAYERGTALKTHCEKHLRSAQEKIEKITVGTNGAISTQPLDNQE